MNTYSNRNDKKVNVNKKVPIFIHILIKAGFYYISYNHYLESTDEALVYDISLDPELKVYFLNYPKILLFRRF